MSMACFSRDPHPHLAPLTKITAADTLAGLRERPAPLPFGRSPAFRGSLQARSSAGERCPDAAEVSGPIPGAPTTHSVTYSAASQASRKLPIPVLPATPRFEPEASTFSPRELNQLLLHPKRTFRGRPHSFKQERQAGFFSEEKCSQNLGSGYL